MKIPDTKTQLSATDEVFDLLDAHLASAAVIAAMELGLFWHLDQGIISREEIASLLDLPRNRTQYWLQYLCKLGLLEQAPGGYSLSTKARSGILDSYSQETWAFLAREAREQFPVFQFYTSHFRYQGSLWEVAGITPPNYFEQMSADLDRARKFTRMLYELHQPFAEFIADRLEMEQINSLLDLGGGSGVMSMALLRRNPQLLALVVDIPNVCTAGREIAIENTLESRLIFHPANFLEDELPAGFDMVLECDVGIYCEDLFNKIQRSLNPDGRYVIIDQFAPAKDIAPSSRLSWAIQGSVKNPDFTYTTAKEIVSMLEKSGYQSVTAHELPRFASKSIRFTEDMYMITAYI